MELKIKNRHLVSLAKFLGQIPLTGTDSRERTKFIQICAPHVEELEKRRREMAESYAEKDEDGKAMFIENEEGRSFDINEENQEKFNVEFAKIMDEEFSISVEVGNLTKLRTVKRIVLESELQFNGQMAYEYDAWCEALESLDLS